MSQIKKLDFRTINQIAAGEVIERPASAIKELIDNSIDAGSTNIQIEILSKDGRSFRVIDNGLGIEEDDIELAFSPHATSKIQSINDLNELMTKGFRGEALASISSVSKMTCLTKNQKSEHGLKATFDETNNLNKSVSSFSTGTSFEVRDLFFNVPVRLKFLKRPETELQLISDMVREMAIAHPEIKFELINAGKKILQTSGSGDWELTVRELFEEKSHFKYLEIIREEEPLLELKGLVAPLSEARSDMRSIITIVNKRPIRCDIMRKAIRKVYQGFLPAGKYPRIILSLSLNPQQIDINVHPTKREIRYSSPQSVYLLVLQALEKHLLIQSNLNPGENTVLLEDQTNYPEKVQVNFENYKKDLSKGLPAKKSYYEEPNYEAPGEVLENKNQNTNEIISQNPEEKKVSAASLAAFERKLQTEIIPQAEKMEKAEAEFEQEKNTEFSFNLNLQLRQANFSDLKELKQDRANSTDFTLQQGFWLASGQITGDKNLRQNYLHNLNTWLKSVSVQNKQEVEQQELLEHKPIFTNQKRPQLPITALEEIWQRDNWACVYCSKNLLHPKTVKVALHKDPDSWISRLGNDNKLIKTSIFREHQASYDHYLPYIYNMSLATQKDNLFASCRSCNQAKSNSQDQNKWQPKPQKAKNTEIQIGNLFFKAGKLILFNEL